MERRVGRQRIAEETGVADVKGDAPGGAVDGDTGGDGHVSTLRMLQSDGDPHLYCAMRADCKCLGTGRNNIGDRYFFGSTARPI